MTEILANTYVDSDDKRKFTRYTKQALVSSHGEDGIMKDDEIVALASSTSIAD